MTIGLESIFLKHLVCFFASTCLIKMLDNVTKAVKSSIQVFFLSGRHKYTYYKLALVRQTGLACAIAFKLSPDRQKVVSLGTNPHENQVGFELKSTAKLYDYLPKYSKLYNYAQMCLSLHQTTTKNQQQSTKYEISVDV